MSLLADESDQRVAAFVLAGGRSSRMGRDKALLTFAGRPLVSRALSILKDAGLEASIAGARSPLAAFAPVIEDPAPDLGPLSGVCSAFASTSAERAVFLPVDLPLLPASLIAHLLHHACITGSAVTLSTVNGFAQSFPAVLDRSTLPIVKAELEAGRSGCFSAFKAAANSLGEPVNILPVEMLVQTGQIVHPDALPVFRWFLNVNTPADLAEAEMRTPATHLPPSIA